MRGRAQPLEPRVTAEERDAHRAFVTTLGAGAIWQKYLPPKGADDGA